MVFALVVVALLVSVGLYIVLPSVHNTMVSRYRSKAKGNLVAIADALNSYRRTHGSYPTPVVVDAAGKPLYSWRVLVLPQLGYQSLYQDFQLDQPWDSPTNYHLMMKMPPAFACPGNTTALAMYESNFALITGPRTLFPGPLPVDPDTMLDRSAETLLVVETMESGIKWSEPGDLNMANGVALGQRPYRDIGGNFSECALGVMVDGTPIEIAPHVSPTLLQGLVTPDGGEMIDLTTIRYKPLP